jgi:hypothetical protein
MATHWFNEGKKYVLENGLSGVDVRAAMLMTNTTADTENDGIVNLDDITTLDECDGSGYARVALTGEAITKDDANDRALFDANDVAWGTIGAATRAVAGVLIYVEVGADSADIPLVWLEYASPKTMDGSAFTSTFNAAGISELT